MYFFPVFKYHLASCISSRCKNRWKNCPQ